MSGDVVTVTSGKGGVGKTTTAVNLAVALRQRGHPVAVVDADLGMPNVAGFLDLEADRSIHDVLAGEADVEAAVVEPAEGLGVLVGDHSLEGFANADPAALEGVVETLAERYSYVLVDTGGGLTYEGLLPLELGDETILVSSPDPAAVGDTTKSRELAERLGVPVRGVVVTHATGETDPEAVADEIGVDVLGVVPLEPAVHDSTAAGVPVAAFAPDSAAAAAYDSVAAAMADDEAATLDPLDSKARKPDDVDGGAAGGGDDADGSAADAGDENDATDDVAAADEASATEGTADGGVDDGPEPEQPDDDGGTGGEAPQATDGGPEAKEADAETEAPEDDIEDDSAAGDDADAEAEAEADAESESAGSSGGFFSRIAGIFG